MNKSLILPLITGIAGLGLGFWSGRSYVMGNAGQPLPVLPAKAGTAGTLDARAGVEASQRINPVLHMDEKTQVEERFVSLARHADPREAFSQVEAAGKDKEKALAILLREWIKAGTLSEERKQRLLDRIKSTDGQDGQLGALASILEDASLASYRGPFMEAFRNNCVRSVMFPWMLGQDAADHPDKMAGICRDWLPWEKTQFMAAATKRWAANHPALARDWCLQHPGQNDSLLAEATSWLVRQDKEVGRRLLETSRNPVEQQTAAGELGRMLAMEDTRQAVEWANGLPEGPVKDAAHEAIFQAVPRGVGAILSRTPDGLPQIRTVMEAGPFARAGFQADDILAGIETEAGWQGFSGTSLQDVTGSLRGEPGTQLTVVAMRRDAASGKLVELRKTVTREQLVLRSKPN